MKLEVFASVTTTSTSHLGIHCQHRRSQDILWGALSSWPKIWWFFLVITLCYMVIYVIYYHQLPFYLICGGAPHQFQRHFCLNPIKMPINFFSSPWLCTAWLRLWLPVNTFNEKNCGGSYSGEGAPRNLLVDCSGYTPVSSQCRSRDVAIANLIC